MDEYIHSHLNEGKYSLIKDTFLTNTVRKTKIPALCNYQIVFLGDSPDCKVEYLKCNLRRL